MIGCRLVEKQEQYQNSQAVSVNAHNAFVAILSCFATA